MHSSLGMMSSSPRKMICGLATIVLLPAGISASNAKSHGTTSRISRGVTMLADRHGSLLGSRIGGSDIGDSRRSIPR